MRISYPRRAATLACASLLILVAPALADPVQFESAQIHPITIDQATHRLHVVNTPDHRLSTFDISGPTPVLISEVRTGLEPVTVKVAPDGNLWVACELSDAINIISPTFQSVITSLNVGDEPSDLVFVDDPTQPGQHWVLATLSQKDQVVICEADEPYALVAVIDIPGSDPRAMAVTPDGSAVWVAAFDSGNRTTMIPRAIVKDPAGPWGGNPPPYDPPLNPDLPTAIEPDNGVMARFSGGKWLDDKGGDWTSLVAWRHDDVDLVKIGIDASPGIDQVIRGVGTLLEDLAIDPGTGNIWVANVEQKNEIRFEPNLKGDFAENRVTEVDPNGGGPQVHQLNRHLLGGPVVPKFEAIDFTLAQRNDSLAFPTEVLFATVDGATRIFVTSIGGKRIAKLNPATGNVMDRYAVPEGGIGLAYHQASQTLYMLNKLDNSILQVDAVTGAQGASTPVGKSGWDPTPADIREGRRFLYTGAHSATGGLGCVHCHPNGNMDNQSWDLGDPSGTETPWIPPEENGDILINPFHPLKGPMTTQSLRGLANTGRLHWRGDRDTFLDFNGAFASLLGGTELSPGEMLKYETFALSLTYPPNPFLSLRDELPTNHPDNGGDALVGEFLFMFNNNQFCQTCHELPLGTQGLIFPIENLTGFGEQPVKIPHLRNMHEKTGFHDRDGLNKRVNGYLHDGMDEDLNAFVEDPVAGLTPDQWDDMVAFLLSFRTGTHPATGAEATLSPYNQADAATVQRRDDIIAGAAEGSVDLIVHGWTGGEERGFVYSGGVYQSDRHREIWTLQDLMDEVTNIGTCFTFTGVPLGEGIRMGVDRDLDGFFDKSEEDMGTDPANPDDAPTAIEDFGGNPSLNRITSVFPAPFSQRATIEFYLSAPAPVTVAVFDVRGRKVHTVLDQSVGEGRHSFVWNGRDQRGVEVAAGTYFVKMTTPNSESGRKISRLK